MENRVKALEDLLAAQNIKIADQDKKIDELKGVIGAAKSSTIDLKSKIELPTIPKELLKHKNKEYKWAAASFFLPGDSTRYNAQDVISDVVVIEKLLKVNGQKVLIEQV